ncbi:hypothetical protein AB0D67_09165 [Streptosporangium sp. NPDC048047]|uniref:hypothetical protein n=1 Tax=Streptosporangium sp. NPDC048047 TaxID=3155748 RepID=UPI003447C1F8
MSAMTHAERGGWGRGLPPGLITDLPVLGFLVACWLLVPVAWAHLATGVALAGLVGVHLRTRSRRVARLRRRGSRPKSARAQARRWGYRLLLASVGAMAVTGSLRWVGAPPEHTWHGGFSYLMLTAVVAHLWSVRRPLRARLRPPGHGAEPAKWGDMGAGCS